MLNSTPSLLINACGMLPKYIAQQTFCLMPTMSAADCLQAGPSAACGSLLQQHRCKHEVRMVLLKDHDKLGKAGDMVKVKAGHARYTLFPHGEADYAVPAVIRNLKERGLLSAQALQQLQRGSQQQRGASAVDPAKLPVEQQIPQILQLLSEKGVVISRRFNTRQPEEPMIGEVTADHLVHSVAQQLKVDLPPELVLMHKQQPITQFGSYRVPLKLQDDDGQQAELAVTVEKTRRSSRVRQLRQKWLFFGGQQQQQQQRGRQQATARSQA